MEHVTIDDLSAENRWTLTSPRSLEACRILGLMPDELVEKTLEDFIKPGVKRAVSKVRYEGHLQNREDMVELVKKTRETVIRKDDAMEGASMMSEMTQSTAPTAITIAEERHAKMMERRAMNNARGIQREVVSLVKKHEKGSKLEHQRATDKDSKDVQRRKRVRKQEQAVRRRLQEELERNLAKAKEAANEQEEILNNRAKNEEESKQKAEYSQHEVEQRAKELDEKRREDEARSNKRRVDLEELQAAEAAKVEAKAVAREQRLRQLEEQKEEKRQAFVGELENKLKAAHIRKQEDTGTKQHELVHGQLETLERLQRRALEKELEMKKLQLEREKKAMDTLRKVERAQEAKSRAVKALADKEAHKSQLHDQRQRRQEEEAFLNREVKQLDWERKKHKVQRMMRRCEARREDITEQIENDNLRSEAIRKTKSHLAKERANAIKMERIQKDRADEVMYNLQVQNFRPVKSVATTQQLRRKKHRKHGKKSQRSTLPQLSSRDAQPQIRDLGRGKLHVIAGRLGDLGERIDDTQQFIRPPVEKAPTPQQSYAGQNLQLPKIV